ncbi:MAG TPA: hypothetical protein VGR00_10655 [Thermoanaerobaculia bacterium]|nr:hypothetical protein [Thermoanaerobaculia bacterium]
MKRALLLVLVFASVAPAAAAPLTTHPRLWVTSADLPRLRGWATMSNPMYANGFLPALNQAVTNYDTVFFPGGNPAVPWPDGGTANWEYYCTEAYAQMFAFASLVDNDPVKRADYAQRARRLLMVVMNAAAAGPDPNPSPAPYRDVAFATYNRANYWSEAFGLTVDWIYPVLTPSDKATIRSVFLRWASECLVAATAGQEHPQPVGLTNDLTLLGSSASQTLTEQHDAQMQLRWAANNYFAGHARNIALMSLSMDAADDPPVNPMQPPTQLGNTLRSYIADYTGAWLYQQYSMYEKASIVEPTYGVPAGNQSIGLASGGLPVEGFLYGESLGYLNQALLALYTAGYDTTNSGPQAGLIASAFWDRYIDGFLHSTSPVAHVPPVGSGDEYLGPVYSIANYGDLLRFWVTYEHIQTLGPLGVYDQLTGNTARFAKERWMATNLLEGGSASLYGRASGVWGNSNASYSILYFLLFDPTAPAPSDPHPSTPLSFVAPDMGRILARTDWGPNASWFTYLCNWETINHQDGSANQFELYRKGEWLTKEWTGYANDFLCATPTYANSFSIQNAVPSDLQWFEGATSTLGGQWTNGANAGDPVSTISVGNGYAYALGITTPLYNKPSGGANDVTHASRSILWLSPDHIVVYDRATTSVANRFKRFNLAVLSAPSIVGKTATVTMPSGQKLFVQSLLPAGATVSEQHNWTTSPDQEFNLVAELEPARNRILIEDPSNPNNVRFLTVLQGADAGGAQTPLSVVSSSAGTAFTGALVGAMLVLFPVDVAAPFTSTTFTVTNTATRYLVTGLTPNASYNATFVPMGSNFQVTVSPGAGHTADSGGVLDLSPCVMPDSVGPAVTAPAAVTTTQTICS